MTLTHFLGATFPGVTPLLTLVMLLTCQREEIRVRMSVARQATHLEDSFTGAGYRPVFTPAHHWDLLTGNTERTAGKRHSANKSSNGGFVMAEDGVLI